MTLMHASCAARGEAGLLLLGASGSGKSDLLLRLLDIGFEMVGDDQIEVLDGYASPAGALAGLLEVRGLGILRLPHRGRVRLALAVELGPAERLPVPRRHAELGLPLLYVNPFTCSAARLVSYAFECATGRIPQVAGAFAS